MYYKGLLSVFCFLPMEPVSRLTDFYACWLDCLLFYFDISYFYTLVVFGATYFHIYICGYTKLQKFNNTVGCVLCDLHLEQNNWSPNACYHRCRWFFTQVLPITVKSV